MKKLVLMFVAVAAISFASCDGNKTAKTDATADTTAQVDSAADSTATTDSTAADSTAADSATATPAK